MGEKTDFYYLHALNCHPKIGSQTLKKLLHCFSTGKKIWESPNKDIVKCAGEKIAELVSQARSEFDPEKEAEKLGRLDIGYITLYDDNYPKRLKELYDAPVILYIKGSLGSLEINPLAIVGSRKYTPYGMVTAKKLAKDCVVSGLTIVSGLALGIDSAAHVSSLDAKGLTVGVLGCGLDEIYPLSNRDLAEKIINSGGAVISEYPPGTPAYKQNFPARNRIIAGLSLGTVVVEAAEKSGALITAYLSLDYGREVFAVPGNIDSPMSAGTNLLIKQGAKLVQSVEDILAELRLTKIKKQEEPGKATQTKEEKLVLKALEQGLETPDQIAVFAQTNIVVISQAITSLEVIGLIQNVGGGRFKAI